MSSPLEVVIKRTSSSQQANRAIQKEAQVISQHGAKLITLEKESVQKLKPLIAPVSGFLAAFTEITLMFPMEYCKVQLQLNRKNTKFSLFEHLKERKFKIYQGLPPMLIGAPLQGLLRFSSLDIITRNLQGLPPILTGVTAGIVAGTIESILVVTPMETVKTKLIDSRKGLFEGVRFIINTQGISGLYNGLWPTILKSASNQGIRFVVFNEYKTFILQKRQQQEKLEEAFDLKSLKSATNSISSKSGLTALQSLTGGVLAGLIGVLLNTPFDTVKSRMQGIEGARYKSTYNCAKMMIAEEGLLSLYKGLLLRSARVVPGQGVIFLVYEQTSKKLTTYIDNY